MRKEFAAALLISSCVLSLQARAQTAPLSPIEQSTLAKDAFATGLLDRSAGALPADLWRGADARSLSSLLAAAPSRPGSPAIGDALRRVLLSPGDTPSEASAALGGAKLKALVRAGFIDEAREIEGLADGADKDPASIEAMASADLLSGDAASACEKGRRVTPGKENPFWVKLRVVCYAANNELDAAELALGILRESGALGATDEALFSPLASGGKPKAPPQIENALHFAALKAMTAPVDAASYDAADGGVLVALSADETADWRARLSAARRAAASGVMSGVRLRALYTAAPAEAAGAYNEIRAMTAPELLRDKAARIAAEIGAVSSFGDLYAAALLYADDIQALEGAVVPDDEAANFGLARLAAGDAVGAERWLLSAAPAMARGMPEDRAMRFIDLVGVLGALEPASASRVATAANVSVATPRPTSLSHDEPAHMMAPIVAAAIDAAAKGAAGQSALAALASSDAAAKGDPVAAAVFGRSLGAAGLADIARRRAVEDALSAIYPEGAVMQAPPAASAAPASHKFAPRLKPKRET